MVEHGFSTLKERIECPIRRRSLRGDVTIVICHCNILWTARIRKMKSNKHLGRIYRLLTEFQKLE